VKAGRCFGLLAILLANGGLKLWVVPRVALGIAAIKPEGGAIAALGRRSYGREGLAVKEDDPADLAVRLGGATSRPGGRELALGRLGRDDGIGSGRAGSASCPALALRPEIACGNPVG